MNILIIEDNSVFNSKLADSIGAWGYCVEGVVSGEEALTKLQEKHFDLLLLDIFLPDCKGYELIPKIRELYPKSRIIAMTDFNTRDLELKSRLQGVLFYLIKPFKQSVLKEILDHISIKAAGVEPENRINESYILKSKAGAFLR